MWIRIGTDILIGPRTKANNCHVEVNKNNLQNHFGLYRLYRAMLVAGLTVRPAQLMRNCVPSVPPILWFHTMNGTLPPMYVL